MKQNQFSYVFVTTFSMLTCLALTTMGCGDEEKTELTTKETCSLKLDKLDGTEWVYLDTSQRPALPSTRARIKFYTENNRIMAKYNSLSFAEMYDYECKLDSQANQLQCNTVPKAEEVCKAYLAGEKKCTPNAMAKFYDKFDEATLKTSIKSAQEADKKAYADNDYKKFKETHNKLGNKLMGRLKIDVKSDDCTLSLYDYYSTINNGDIVENGNPVGTNPFVSVSDLQTTLKLPSKPELMWKHCESNNLFDTQSADFPAKPEAVEFIRAHAIGDTVHYWLLEDKTRKIEGCTYTYDLYLNSILKEKGLKPQISEDGKETRFYYSHTYQKATIAGTAEVLVMDVTKSCEEKPPENIISCNIVYIR